MVSTPDSESGGLSSNLSRTCFSILFNVIFLSYIAGLVVPELEIVSS